MKNEILFLWVFFETPCICHYEVVNQPKYFIEILLVIITISHTCQTGAVFHLIIALNKCSQNTKQQEGIYAFSESFKEHSIELNFLNRIKLHCYNIMTEQSAPI